MSRCDFSGSLTGWHLDSTAQRDGFALRETRGSYASSEARTSAVCSSGSPRQPGQQNSATLSPRSAFAPECDHWRSAVSAESLRGQRREAVDGMPVDFASSMWRRSQQTVQAWRSQSETRFMIPRSEGHALLLIARLKPASSLTRFAIDCCGRQFVDPYGCLG